MADSSTNSRLVVGVPLVAFGAVVLLYLVFFSPGATCSNAACTGQASVILGLFFGVFLPVVVGASLIISWFGLRRKARRTDGTVAREFGLSPAEFDGGTPLVDPGSTEMYPGLRPRPPRQ